MSKRSTCTTCLRAQSACICHWITPTAHVVEVVVLQHPLEVGQAKGSARLLQLSLSNSRLVTGEVFATPQLQALLGAPGPTSPTSPQQAGARRPKHAILLYPETPEDQALGLATAPLLSPAMLREPSQLRLIVLDGTWRKSRKMLYLNPLLQQLPRVALRGMPASNYLIRKAHRLDQLSTLEATCAALAQLEGGIEPFAPLLAAFDGFVAQQLAYRRAQAEPPDSPDQ